MYFAFTFWFSLVYKVVFYISNDILQPLTKISNWKLHCEIWRSHSGGDESLSLLYTKTCRPVSIYQLYGGTCCTHFQDTPTMKKKAESLSDTAISNTRLSVLSNKTCLWKRHYLTDKFWRNLLITNIIELRKRNSLPMFNSEFRRIKKRPEYFLE